MQIPLELLDNRRPTLAAGMLSRIQAHPAQRLHFFQQPARCIDKRRLVPRHGQRATVAMANMLRRGRLVISNHRQP
ncbi:hypothetical protein D3C71_2106300 [compost metagenome]